MLFDVDVITGTDMTLSGEICFPDNGDEVTEDSIIVIPNGGPNYHIPGMKCKAVITEIGNRLCHLAIVTRECRKPIVRLPKALTVLKNVKRVVIDGESATIKIIKEK